MYFSNSEMEHVIYSQHHFFSYSLTEGSLAALCSSALDKSRSHNTLIQLFTESLVSARHCSNAGDPDRHEQQGQKPLCSLAQSRSQTKPQSRRNGRSDVVNVWRIVKHGRGQ